MLAIVESQKHIYQETCMDLDEFEWYELSSGKDVQRLPNVSFL